MANFLFETSAFKRVKRTGWQILWVEEENVAEHVWHAMIAGYCLAKLAGVDAEKVVLMLLSRYQENHGCQPVGELVLWYMMFAPHGALRLAPRLLSRGAPFHDLAEIRIGDIHKLQGLYVSGGEEEAVVDQVEGLSFSKEIVKFIDTFRAKEIKEVQIAHDADVLALLVRLK